MTSLSSLSPLGTYVVVDVETAGFTRDKGFLLEIALVFVAKGQVLGHWSQLIIPPTPRWDFSPMFLESRKVHKIPSGEIRKYGIPEEEAAARAHRQLDLFFADHGMPTFVAHNASFERRWLSSVPWSFPIEVCSLELARAAQPKAEGGHKLVEVAKRLGVAVDGEAHRALPDALLTAKVLLALLEPAQPAQASQMLFEAVDAVERELVEPELAQEFNRAVATLLGHPPAPSAPPVPTQAQPEFPGNSPEFPPQLTEQLPPIDEQLPPIGEQLPPIALPGDYFDQVNAFRDIVRNKLALRVAANGVPQGDEADDLLGLTCSAIRLLLFRGGHEAEDLLHELARRINQTSPPRFPPTPRTQAARLWGREVLTPMGEAEVTARCIPGLVYRRADGRMVALTKEEAVKLGVANEDR